MTRNEPELASSAGGGFTGLGRCLASGGFVAVKRWVTPVVAWGFGLGGMSSS